MGNIRKVRDNCRPPLPPSGKEKEIPWLNRGASGFISLNIAGLFRLPNDFVSVLFGSLLFQAIHVT